MRTPGRTTTTPILDGWRFRELEPGPVAHSEPGAWLSAQVPGHVHLDLHRAGVIADPFERMHERGVQWVDDRAWAYQCTFELATDALEGARHLLRFDGLDTVATVLLNEEVVGTTDNMFVPHELDVTAALRPGANVLEVRFASAERVGEERRAVALEALGDSSGLALGLMVRSVLRKAQYMWGWDWGPQLRGCGIWQDVSLVRIPTARIRDWSWRATFADDGSCQVAVRAEADGDCDEVRVSLAGREGLGPLGGEVVLPVDDPQRWWPAGHGDQHLYDLRLELLADGEVVDERTARVGLREVELVREPDEAGESFAFHVNGVPIYAKGANWIPDDSFPARTTVERVRTQLKLARDCGMNMIRVWGGGLYESTDFYEACDELGLLVWQDFPFACALYPEDDAFVEAVSVEARAAIRRIRNHTSLALWCGNNENQWLVSMALFGGVDLPMLGARLYDETLPALVEQEDPGRAYWPSSPYGTGPDPSGEADGDCHYWNVWHGEGDWVHYEKCTARFVSEFGFSGPPDLRTLEECLDPDELDVDGPAMRWHDKTGKGYETYLGFIELHYPASATTADLVYYGQLNQAEAMRFGIEHFRRLRPHNMGTLVWQLNDCWPVQSWAWIDHRLRPKAAWYAARRFYAPLLLSLWREDSRLRAHLVNDATAPREGTLLVRAIDHDGTVLWSTTSDQRAGAGASEDVLDLVLPREVLDAAPHAIVHATFADVEATLLLVEPKDLALPTPELRITAEPAGERTRLRIETGSLALSVALSLADGDATWSDNFVHVVPGLPREVEVTPADGRGADAVLASLRWRTL